MPRWWQDEAFWRDVGPFLFPPVSWQAAREDIEEVIELLEVEPGQTVADLGCGPGRLLFPLLEQGLEVVGIDHCSFFRRRVREHAKTIQRDVDVRALDLLGRVEQHMALRREQGAQPSPEAIAESLELGRFHAVLDVFALVGYHEAPVVDAVLVQTFLHLLEPGGMLLIQTRNPEMTSGTVKHTDGQGGICVEERRYDRSSRIMSTRWSVHARGRQRALQSQVRVYQPSDLKGLLEFAGFADVHAWSARTEERVTVIGRRPL